MRKTGELDINTLRTILRECAGFASETKAIPVSRKLEIVQDFMKKKSDSEGFVTLSLTPQNDGRNIPDEEKLAACSLTYSMLARPMLQFSRRLLRLEQLSSFVYRTILDPGEEVLDKVTEKMNRLHEIMLDGKGAAGGWEIDELSEFACDEFPDIKRRVNCRIVLFFTALAAATAGIAVWTARNLIFFAGR